MKLTKKQRDEAVALLRCAADEYLHCEGPWGWAAATEALGLTFDSRFACAVPAKEAVYPLVAHPDRGDVWYGMCLLEAAALLEDGWNPGDPVERIGGGR